MLPSYKVQRFKCRLVKDGRTAVVPHVQVCGSFAAADVFFSVLRDVPHEEVWMILCNAKNDVAGLVRLSQGGMHGAALTPADVLRPVIAAGVGAFILGHNHPSGDATPSDADVKMTKLLIKAAGIVGLTCLDHIIVTAGKEWVSLRERMSFDDD